MQLKTMGRLLAAALLSVAAGCQGDEAPAPEGASLETQKAEATQCVQQFNGITSCALGRAKLTPSEKGLQVGGLVDASKDGVSGTFAKATRWTQNVDIKFGTAQAGLSLAARAGDQVVGTLQVTPGRDGTSAGILPSFSGAPGGSDYRMNVYNKGVLQGGTTQPAGRMMYFNNWYDLIRWVVAVFSFDNGYDIIIFKPGQTQTPAATQTIPGACVWRIHNQRGTFSVTLDDGTVLTGDSVEFVEQIADGHYPYTDFTSIDVRAAANEFTVTGESFVPAK